MDRDDLAIVLSDPIFPELPTEPTPDEKAQARGYPESGGVRVYVTQKAWESALSHTRRSPEAEVGGMLVGRPYNDAAGDGLFVVVEAALPTRLARSTRSRLTFTHEAWDEIEEALTKRGLSDRQIVGWYHSHPGFGIFLSRDDRFIHENYFRQPWHVALVINPVNERAGFFRWHKGQIEKCGGFFLIPDSSGKGRPQYRDRSSGTPPDLPNGAGAGCEAQQRRRAPIHLVFLTLGAAVLILAFNIRARAESKAPGGTAEARIPSRDNSRAAELSLKKQATNLLRHIIEFGSRLTWRVKHRRRC